MPGIPKPILPPGAQQGLTGGFSVRPFENRFDSNRVNYEQQTFVKNPSPFDDEDERPMYRGEPEEARFDGPTRQNWNVLPELKPLRTDIRPDPIDLGPEPEPLQLDPDPLGVLKRMERERQREEYERAYEPPKNDMLKILEREDRRMMQGLHDDLDDEIDLTPPWLRNLR